jgi:hypothetical protein
MAAAEPSSTAWIGGRLLPPAVRSIMVSSRPCPLRQRRARRVVACWALVAQLGALGCGAPQAARRSADAGAGAACTTLEQCIAECHARAKEDAGYRPACASVAARYESGSDAAGAELASRYHRLAEGLPPAAPPTTRTTEPAPAGAVPCSSASGLTAIRRALAVCLDLTRRASVMKVPDLTAVELACIEESSGISLRVPLPEPAPCLQLPLSITTQ